MILIAPSLVSCTAQSFYDLINGIAFFHSMREYLFFTTWIPLKIIIIITLMLSLVVSNHLREAVKNYLADFSR